MNIKVENTIHKIQNNSQNGFRDILTSVAGNDTQTMPFKPDVIKFSHEIDVDGDGKSDYKVSGIRHKEYMKTVKNNLFKIYSFPNEKYMPEGLDLKIEVLDSELDKRIVAPFFYYRISKNGVEEKIVYDFDVKKFN